jgi:hypothetical protein
MEQSYHYCWNGQDWRGQDEKVESGKLKVARWKWQVESGKLKVASFWKDEF